MKNRKNEENQTIFLQLKNGPTLKVLPLIGVQAVK